VTDLEGNVFECESKFSSVDHDVCLRNSQVGAVTVTEKKSFSFMLFNIPQYCTL
jgi:hypothetical protein